jgi:hypothetical protein
VDKKIRLPKEQFIDGQDVEGHRIRMNDRNVEDPGPDGVVRRTAPEQDIPQVDEDDVTAHRDDFTVLPAPPSIGLRRTPGHGGELTGDEDVEGHRLR